MQWCSCARAGPGYGDPDNFQIEDCNTQRNLDEAGRRQAEAIGRYFREHQITFTAILSSRWCCCTQTAELLNYGSWSEFDGLNSFFQGHVDRQETLALLRDKLDSLSSDDMVLMVTHQVVISAITDISPPSGGLIVQYSYPEREAGQGPSPVTVNFKETLFYAAETCAEMLGTFMLVLTVVGSGIMAEQLSAGIDGLALLGNTLATGCILIVLITILGPVSGAHFNPAVTLTFFLLPRFPARTAIFYMLCQIAGGFAGNRACSYPV